MMSFRVCKLEEVKSLKNQKNYATKHGPIPKYLSPNNLLYKDQGIRQSCYRVCPLETSNRLPHTSFEKKIDVSLD